MRPSPPNAGNLQPAQVEALKTRLIEACDRLSDDQILDLADALHDAIRLRQRLRWRTGARSADHPEDESGNVPTITSAAG